MKILNLKKQAFLNNLEKAFFGNNGNNQSDGNGGFYVDNFKNRKLGRVGQPYSKKSGDNNKLGNNHNNANTSQTKNRVSTPVSKFYQSLSSEDKKKYKPIFSKFHKEFKKLGINEKDADGQINFSLNNGKLKVKFESNSSHGVPFSVAENQNKIRDLLSNYNSLNLETGKIEKDKSSTSSLNKDIYIDGLSKEDKQSLSSKQIDALNKFYALEEELDCYGGRGLYYEDGKFGFDSGIGDSWEQAEEKKQLDNYFSKIEDSLNTKLERKNTPQNNNPFKD